VVRRGGNWATLSLMLGEATNMIQIPWLTSKLLGYLSVFNALSLPMTASFVLFRGVILPIFFSLYFYDTHFNSEHPTLVYAPYIEVYFTLCFVAMLLGSFIWLKKMINGYLKSIRKGKEAGKGKKEQ
jgi:hypothetical protein